MNPKTIMHNSSKPPTELPVPCITDTPYNIFKRKRTKRHPPHQSPISSSMNIITDTPNNSDANYSPSSSSSSKTDEASTSDIYNNLNPDNHYLSADTPLTPPPPPLHHTTNPESDDKDIANCLILLAQGHTQPLDIVVNYTAQPISSHRTDIRRRRHQEPAAAAAAAFTSNKIENVDGTYVYECKTCFKTFSSFQALGGHRASHKKTKETHHHQQHYNVDARKTTTSMNFNNFLSDDEDQYSPLSLQLLTRDHNVYGFTSSRRRVHQCAICGTEFSSGQALGGHMRRHRGSTNTTNIVHHQQNTNQKMNVQPMPTTTTTTTLSLATRMMLPHSTDSHNNGDSSRRGSSSSPDINKNTSLSFSLDLDLNLPAPPEEYHARR